MKQGELGRSGVGFLCCDTRSGKNYAHLVPYPSGAMTLKRVLSCRAHHALSGSTSRWAKFQLVVELRLEMNFGRHGCRGQKLHSPSTWVER